MYERIIMWGQKYFFSSHPNKHLAKKMATVHNDTSPGIGIYCSHPALPHHFIQHDAGSYGDIEGIGGAGLRNDESLIDAGQ